jgi:hypothetical protein
MDKSRFIGWIENRIELSLKILQSFNSAEHEAGDLFFIDLLRNVFEWALY